MRCLFCICLLGLSVLTHFIGSQTVLLHCRLSVTSEPEVLVYLVPGEDCN